MKESQGKRQSVFNCYWEICNVAEIALITASGASLCEHVCTQQSKRNTRLKGRSVGAHITDIKLRSYVREIGEPTGNISLFDIVSFLTDSGER